MPLQGSFMTLKRVTGGRAQVHGLKTNHSPQWSVWLRMGASLVAQVVKNRLPTQETQVQSLHQEDPLEVGMATHSRVLAWRMPRTEEPGGL